VVVTVCSAPQAHLVFIEQEFTSTAVGLAIKEGHFTLDSSVVSFFPEDLPTEISASLKSMKVQHLLSMSAGHAKDTFPVLRASENMSWAKAFFGVPVEFEPGTHFVYNTGATYMLSAIVQRKPANRCCNT